MLTNHESIPPGLEGHLEGRFETFVRADGISGELVDGRSTRPTDEWLVGEDRLALKVQLTGMAEYRFADAPESEVSGECLVVAHRPRGVAKRQIIPIDARERSITLFFPCRADGSIAGCEQESLEVRSAARLLSRGLLFRRYPLPRALAHCAAAILDCRRSPWTQQRFKRAKIDEMTCLLLEFFLEQFKSSHDHGLTDREKRRVQEARTILSERFDRPPSVDELARKVGLNRTRFNTAFRALYGESVRAALLKERMERARALLSVGHLSVSEIAERCGYGHLSNFSLAYKAHFGVSPSSVRDGPWEIVRLS
jgi:AraC-like DNA-binding protein